ncbi:hypothetical protein [Streptomyces sp. NPDC088752]|uniref:hypothetical protein n=1 Tax=Streptomyces sp. NPDC088752 TaxID=3154963 RepID=UPI00343D7C39
MIFSSELSATNEYELIRVPGEGHAIITRWMKSGLYVRLTALQVYPPSERFPQLPGGTSCCEVGTGSAEEYPVNPRAADIVIAAARVASFMALFPLLLIAKRSLGVTKADTFSISLIEYPLLPQVPIGIDGVKQFLACSQG